MPRHDHAAPAHDLDALALTAGEAWASERIGELRQQQRAIIGAWPGTLTEARSHVLMALADTGLALTIDDVRTLSCTANHAARAAWRLVAETDEEDVT